MSLEASVQRLKVFPLPPVVLFPQTAVPLHIFEPRYRQLVKDAFSSDRLFALAQPLQNDVSPKPFLEPIACVGRIVWDEALDGGRYNVLLHGLSRVRLLEELETDKLYREFRAEVVFETDYPGMENGLVRQAVMEWLKRLPNARVPPWLTQVYGGTLADGIGAAFVDEVSIRRKLLHELSPKDRLLLALDWLGGQLARCPVPPSSDSLH